MAIRGQNNEAWLSRFRKGTCPVHGKGFVADGDRDGEAFPERCPVDECDVRVVRYAAADPKAIPHVRKDFRPPPSDGGDYATFGWRAGPDAIRALLAKAGDIDAEGPAAGPRGRVVRVRYSLNDD